MLNSIIQSEISLSSFLICTVASLILGIATACINMYRSRCSQSFAITLAVIPAIVQIIIMLVNGNIGAGIAVAGAFSLVRFRSLPGTAKEIASIFLAMAIGLATGMGYIYLAVIFFVIVALVMLSLTMLHFGLGDAAGRILKITIPENLDYDGLFDDLLNEYTLEHELIRVRTTNMGTLYELTYNIRLRGKDISKDFIDALRCRNGNLTVSCGREADRDMM